MTRFAIVGFGLMGGSLALAARASGAALHITAIDYPTVLETPEARHAADACVDARDQPAVARALAESMLTFLAVPVGLICDWVGFALTHAPLVTDCGSTKRRILEHAARSPRAAHFVAGHPMAGQPEGGIRNASADLFRDRTWILCPEQAETGAVSVVSEWVQRFGAKLTLMTAAEHDAAVARTSHVPQLLASALLSFAEAEVVKRAAGPAFERATKVAGGPEPMWRDIFATNGDEIAHALRELAGSLSPVAEDLARGNTTLADALLARARAVRTQR